MDPPEERNKEDAREKEHKEENETWNMIREFAGYTTLHGFHFLVDSSSRWRRRIWFLLLLFCCAMFIYQFVISVNRLRAYKVVFSRGAEQPGEVDFPAVTICNKNMLRKSLILNTSAQIYLDEQDADFKRSLKQSNISFDAEEFVKKYGHNITNMLNRAKGCTFKMLYPCSGENFTSFFSFTRGWCYTFNAGANYIQRVSVAGRETRLKLYLDAKSHEYYGPFSYDGVGFKIAVHDQNDVPDMDNGGYDISPGYLTTISVKRFKEVSLPPPFPTKCGSRTLEHYERYSTKGCEYECFAKDFVRKFKCKVLGMAPIKEIRNASFCPVSVVSAALMDFHKNWHLELCDCPKPCETVNYNAQLSTAHYPAPSLLDELSKFPLEGFVNKSKEEYVKFVRDNIVVVEVFYETLLTDVLKEERDYDFNMFASDLGGILGLYLGTSLLTIVEFLDLGIRWCLRRRSDRSQVRSQAWVK
ncbi:acid-sensing ion channel 3 [Nematostella vectensis]|uniref:acid-sensing ion channel 3 n=1 Tax=Nematostella vectensis TaxID=45351 RepID=UPI002077613F|nr:acid-sensing ion channel 3 [Nematostella vectensis]XP_048578097.1 acid-sensing ion channel 3 [Nematostella vectensis]